jgi:hypothetical protein
MSQKVIENVLNQCRIVFLYDSFIVSVVHDIRARSPIENIVEIIDVIKKMCERQRQEST